MHSTMREDNRYLHTPLWSLAAIVDDELQCTVTSITNTRDDALAEQLDLQSELITGGAAL